MPETAPETPADFRDLFEHAPCGYLSTRPDGRLYRVNRTFAEWLGRAQDDLIGQRFQDLLTIAGKIYYETHFAPLLRMQGFFHEVALELLREDGATMPTLVNAVERRDEKGGLLFIRITVFNATDRRRYERELLEARKIGDQANARLRELNATLEKRVADAVRQRLQAEEALRQAQKMEAIGQLTGGIAHDFNNMLAVVLSGLSLLERRLAKGDRDVGRYIAAAKDAANRAVAVTRRLLAFSRRQPLSPGMLDANRMVSQMSEILHHTLGERIHVETVLAGGLWSVCADANQLESAVLNLAVNARDAMPEGGSLTVETANCHLDETYAMEHGIAAGQYVMVAVTDTGSGMAPETLSRAFEPFFSTKAVGRGTGLGLSQVFGFVKQSGGHVKIYSERDHGTAVKVYLPRFYGQAEAELAAVETPETTPPSRDVILVVEDDSRVLEVTVQMLRDLGYDAIPAQGGAQALAALDERPDIRLLFTDIVMAGMNGQALAEAAKARRPDLKILFTTGYTRNAAMHNGDLEPGAHLLPKPATLEEMAAKLSAVLES